MTVVVTLVRTVPSAKLISGQIVTCTLTTLLVYRETGCDPAPPAQLCWSSSSSFSHICTTTSWNWTVTKLI